jgi:hypothetical protein
MTLVVLKFAIAAALIVGITELAKRSPTAGALLASLPITTLLAIAFMYAESRDTQRIAALSEDVFWLVLPSLPSFLFLAWALRSGWNFVLAISCAALLTIALYVLVFRLMGKSLT